jgi:hypothetical protein
MLADSMSAAAEKGLRHVLLGSSIIMLPQPSLDAEGVQ